MLQRFSASLVRVGDVQGVSRRHAVRGKKKHHIEPYGRLKKDNSLKADEYQYPVTSVLDFSRDRGSTKNDVSILESFEMMEVQRLPFETNSETKTNSLCLEHTETTTNSSCPEHSAAGWSKLSHEKISLRKIEQRGVSLRFLEWFTETQVQRFFSPRDSDISNVRRNLSRVQKEQRDAYDKQRWLVVEQIKNIDCCDFRNWNNKEGDDKAKRLEHWFTQAKRSGRPLQIVTRVGLTFVKEALKKLDKEILAFRARNHQIRKQCDCSYSYISANKSWKKAHDAAAASPTDQQEGKSIAHPENQQESSQSLQSHIKAVRERLILRRMLDERRNSSSFLSTRDVHKYCIQAGQHIHYDMFQRYLDRTSTGKTEMEMTKINEINEMKTTENEEKKCLIPSLVWHTTNSVKQMFEHDTNLCYEDHVGKADFFVSHNWVSLHFFLVFDGEFFFVKKKKICFNDIFFLFFFFFSFLFLFPSSFFEI